MRKFAIILIITLASCDLDLDKAVFQRFQKFIRKYNKKYNSIDEFLSRFEAFKKNLISLYENESHSTGITRFFDLTQEEFSKMYLNLNFDSFALGNLERFHMKKSLAAPDAFDWRDKGAVSPVYDQGSSGYSTAVAAMDNLESLYYLGKGKLVSFSQQMIIDCVSNIQMIGYIFQWLKENGIETDADYPYSGYKSTCKADPTKYIDMIVTGVKALQSPADEEEMKEFLYETSPLIVGLNGTPLQTYGGGIIDKTSSECPSSGINHIAVLVGYGHDDNTGKDYWIVKNSWGKSWGESGYFRIKRGSGTCGINCYVMTGTVSF